MQKYLTHHSSSRNSVYVRVHLAKLDIGVGYRVYSHPKMSENFNIVNRASVSSDIFEHQSGSDFYDADSIIYLFL